jgi:hypothetical protein
MARCLKPGGRFLLEIEGKWNLDLFWEIVNALGCNFLDYDEPLSEALSHLLPPWNIGHVIDYSFKLQSGESVTFPLKLFSAPELRRELQSVGLIQDRLWALHVLTNLLPSTILHKSDPGQILKRTFGTLAWFEMRVNHSWPFNSFGCSLLVLAHKQLTPDSQRIFESSLKLNRLHLVLWRINMRLLMCRRVPPL